MLIQFVDTVGSKTVNLCNGAGNLVLFVYSSLVTLFRTKPKIKKIFNQMNRIGVTSLGVVLLTGGAIGAILAIQSYVGLHKFGAERFIGTLVFLSMAREFGPVITAIMVTGRAISAMTAEIGSMRITEQIDALQTLCIDVKQYLIVPKIVATTFILPFLSLFCTLCGILSGYIISVYVLNINAETYMEAVREYSELADITRGLLKAGIFGFLISAIGCYKGYITTGGARGVGIATTQSVVLANVTIFIADYIISSLMSVT